MLSNIRVSIESGKGVLAQGWVKLPILTPLCGCSRSETEVYFVEKSPLHTVNAVGHVTAPYSSMGRSNFLLWLYLISIKRRQLASSFLKLDTVYT